MAVDVRMRVLPNRNLVAWDQSQREELKKFQPGDMVKCHVTSPRDRNYKFLQKFHCMIQVGFDAWEPPEKEFRGMPVVKNEKKFYKDVIIAAGYFTPYYNIKGEVRVEAKSIAFGNMEEEDFEKVYSDCADVLLGTILKHYNGRQELDQVVNKMMSFL